MDECRKQFEELMRQPPYEMDLARHSDAGSWPGNYRRYPVQLAWCAWEDLWNRRAMLEAAPQPPAIDRDAVIEECAKVCERISDEYQEREGRMYPELKTDAETGASECAGDIRALKAKAPDHT